MCPNCSALSQNVDRVLCDVPSVYVCEVLCFCSVCSSGWFEIWDERDGTILVSDIMVNEVR